MGYTHTVLCVWTKRHTLCTGLYRAVECHLPMVTFSLWRPFHSFITFVPATGFSVPYTPLDLRSLLKQFSPTNSPPQTSKPFAAQFRPHVLRSASSDSPYQLNAPLPNHVSKVNSLYVFVWSYDWCLPSLPDRKLHPFCSPLYLKHIVLGSTWEVLGKYLLKE